MRIKKEMRSKFYINVHVFVFVREDIAVQNIVVASLFFKEVSEKVQMFHIRVNTDEAVTLALVLQDWLLNHGVIFSLWFRLRDDWERAFHLSFTLVGLNIQFLFKHLRQECPFYDASIFQILIARLLTILTTGPKANRSWGIARNYSLFVRCLVCSLIFYILLHLLVLESHKIEKIWNQASLDFEVQLRISVKRWTQIDLQKPRFEALIDQNVEAEQFKAIVIFLFRINLTRGVELISVWQVHFHSVPKKRFRRDDRFYYYFVDSLEQKINVHRIWALRCRL